MFVCLFFSPCTEQRRDRPTLQPYRMGVKRRSRPRRSWRRGWRLSQPTTHPPRLSLRPPNHKVAPRRVRPPSPRPRRRRSSSHHHSWKRARSRRRKLRPEALGLSRPRWNATVNHFLVCKVGQTSNLYPPRQLGGYPQIRCTIWPRSDTTLWRTTRHTHFLCYSRLIFYLLCHHNTNEFRPSDLFLSTTGITGVILCICFIASFIQVSAGHTGSVRFTWIMHPLFMYRHLAYVQVYWHFSMLHSFIIRGILSQFGSNYRIDVAGMLCEHRCSTCRNILIATDCALLNAGFVLNYQPTDIITARTNKEKEGREHILTGNKNDTILQKSWNIKNLLLVDAV